MVQQSLNYYIKFLVICKQGCMKIEFNKEFSDCEQMNNIAHNEGNVTA